MAEDKDNLAPEGTTINYIEERNHKLGDLPYEIVRKAWFTLSHLLLDEGAKVIDMGCGEGQMTYAMAVLNPKLKFIGIDKSKRNINKARQTYKMQNLEFKLADVASDVFRAETVDAIIDNFILHEVFSGARYNEQIISDTLRKHYKMLKKDGLLFIHDFVRPPTGEHILMEMHDKKSYGRGVEELSEADLLVWYSEHARPKQDPGCGGFFLEELPARFPKTRLFRLPYKWAYEFIMRKDRRTDITDNLLYEYTFYTPLDFRRELRNLGARVEYSAPIWDDDYIRENFAGHFRLMNLNGDAISEPPTSFLAIARKLPERSSLDIKERRITAATPESPLKIQTLRDQKNGTLIDVATRHKEFAEIFPYRLTEDNRLNIFLHEGTIRGLVNTILRSGTNIDGREWSGHMVEPIAVEYHHIIELDREDKQSTSNFTKEYLGFKIKDDGIMEEGTAYYPDPNAIDERIHTFYIPVNPAKTPMQPKTKILQSHHFHAKGTIREFSAQHILDAIAIGLIPSSRLELQILALMQKLKIKAENWISRNIAIERGEITQRLNLREYLQQVANSDNRFKEVKGNAGQLRTVNSIFVEEGQNQGGRTGLSSQNIDFFLSDDTTINTAVVLPLTSSARGDLYAGFLIKHAPVPQRYEGKSLTICAPQINIPKEITDHKMLKEFIAQRLSATPEMIIKLGESYFTHIGITPHRIFPYAIVAPPAFYKDPDTKFMPFYQYMLLWKSLSTNLHLMTVIARAYRFLPDHIKLSAKKNVMKLIDDIFQKSQPDWSMPSSIEPTGSKANKSGKPRVLVKIPKPEDTRQTPSEDIKDAYARREKEKKERRDRKKMGIEQKITDPDEEDDVRHGGDIESMENINKKSTAANKIDLNIVEDLKNEINSIKDIIDEQNGPKLDKS